MRSTLLLPVQAATEPGLLVIVSGAKLGPAPSGSSAALHDPSGLRKSGAGLPAFAVLGGGYWLIKKLRKSR
jgi:hypothetical protein